VIVALADFTTLARSAVQRDKYTRDIEVAPSPEGPGRFARELAVLWTALETMGHQDAVEFVRRVALDSITPARSAIISALAADGQLDTNQLLGRTRLSKSSNRRIIEDLTVLRIVVQVKRGSENEAAVFGLSEEARAAWSRTFQSAIPINTTEREKRESIEGGPISESQNGSEHWSSIFTE
jgi:hypothetical protein